MEAEKFDLIFRGDIVLGHAVDDVKLRLQQLFKADAGKIDALFTGRPVILKRNLDKGSADKYRQVLYKAGAQVRLAPSGQTQAAPSEAKTRQAQGLSLAPAGGYLVKPEEHRRLTPVSVDISRLSIRAAEGELLDSNERAAAPDLHLTIPDFDVAEAGADLLSPDERQDLPLMAVEPEDWGLAEVGSDLLTPSERPKIESVAPANTDFDLAPVGSDMGEKKEQVVTKLPDTSNLHLVDRD
jgi:hypothetical protein